MAFAVEGYAAIAQNFIGRQVASNFYPRCPLLGALGAFTLSRNNKNSLNIGRYDKGEVLNGKVIDPASRMKLGSLNFFQPRIQRYETNNSKEMGKYDTRPEVFSPTTNAHSQATQAAAKFARCKLETPIWIWHSDKERVEDAPTEAGQRLSQAQLINEAVEVAYQEHISRLNWQIWNGNPANQNADHWNQPLGVLQVFSTTNTYGGIDRTTLPAGHSWLPQVDSTLKAVDIDRIIQDAKVTKGITDQGGNIDLVICPKNLYNSFRAQVKSAGPTVVRVKEDGIPGMAAMGFHREALQIDDTYVMYDSSCPANTVLCFDMSTWFFMVKAGRNVKVEPFKDLTDNGPGAYEADYSVIVTEYIFACNNPSANVKYTAIGT